ncbi:hypothetical protein [Bosea vaviloviae]|uniref:Uncharacterized protein n=1 Tax=Bosea vaviloviae TaxID=1526658 RepID=A0A1D7U2Q5_9HYPH|nr:hypothetical protein [Bosea vaviloviae]AOO81659.1 hypothetical protein BHK69_15430 [Bosea vaviloviae]
MTVGPAVAFVRYDETGAVTEWGRMALGVIERQRQAGARIIAGGGGPDFYVDLETREVRPKQDNPAWLDGMTLRDVPVPATIVIGRTAYEGEDAVVELEFSLPGTYAIEVRSLRQLTKTFEVKTSEVTT